MAMGPGKYDDLCTYVRTQAKADCAFVIVIGGDRGHGFSAQVTGAVETLALLPDWLEGMAAQIRADIEAARK